MPSDVRCQTRILRAARGSRLWRGRRVLRCVLLDKTNKTDYKKLGEVTDKFMADLENEKN